MPTMTEIEKIQKHAKRIASGKDSKVQPGMPARFTEAATIDDCIWQGDLALVIAAEIPDGYEKSANPSSQLVPGNTQGAKHCLDSLDGVELWLPKVWNEEVLEGPYMRLSKERTVLHPTHGPVTIPAGFSVQCHYQKEWDREQAKERRARD